jgi:hypothetical protein
VRMLRPPLDGFQTTLPFLFAIVVDCLLSATVRYVQGAALALELFELLPYCNQGDAATDTLVLSSLASQDVDYLTVDDNGNSLLMIACQYKLEDACKIMIQNEVDVNTKNAMGATPLHFACADGTQSIEVRVAPASTALAMVLMYILFAARQRCCCSCELRATSGCDTGYVSKKKRPQTQTSITTAISQQSRHQIAADQQRQRKPTPLLSPPPFNTQIQVADLLLRHGAKANAIESSTGCTPLHYAALVEDIDFVRLLLRARADPLAQDYEDYLPVDYARDAMLSEHTALLTAAGTVRAACCLMWLHAQA